MLIFQTLMNNEYNMTDLPPTLYELMESMENFGKLEENKTPVSGLAAACRSKIFDFDYPLSNNIDEEDFETQILNHFIMRRIGFETYTAFKLMLNTKLNEIMPYYNKMFDALSSYNLFTTGETTSKSVSTSGTSSNQTTGENENRYSEYPQSQLTNISSGSYVSNQNLSTNTGSSTLTNTGSSTESTTRSPLDKMDIMKKYLEVSKSTMSMIYKDLESLFYQLVD